jgi:hypothetical protein
MKMSITTRRPADVKAKRPDLNRPALPGGPPEAPGGVFFAGRPLPGAVGLTVGLRHFLISNRLFKHTQPIIIIQHPGG